MNERTLSRIFGRILSTTAVSAVAPLALAAGCGIDTSGFDAPLCNSGFLALDPIMPKVAVDYVELRSSFEFGSGPMVVAQSGTRCKTATDRPGCENKVAAAQSMTPTGIFMRCSDACTKYFGVTTQGDVVQTLDTPDGFKDFFGTVDTAQEALYLAWAAGYGISCGDKDRGAVRRVDGGFEVVGTKGTGCGSNDDVHQYLLFVDSAGNVTVRADNVIQRGNPGCAIGRRPAGLSTCRSTRRGSALGRYFARASRLEAASVSAFRILRDELRRHRAPARLIALAERAADDEIRHAVVTARIARSHGGRPMVAQVRPRPLRSLAELAIENAVEGCVREAFGALVASYQAAHAADPDVAQAMRAIATDETRHAALAFQIHRWAQRHLSASERERIAAAQLAAVRELRDELLVAPEPAVQREAGLPDAAVACALLDQASRLLWAAA